MSDLPRVHTGEPLVLLADDEIAYRANRGKWTLTEALFHLSGHKPPGYESAHHLQDHFWPAYHQAVDAIQMGNICRKIEQAGETVFIDSPANWLAWADSLGPKHIEVDERVRWALSQAADIPDTAASDGSSTPKHMDAGSQAGKEPKDEAAREIAPGRPSLKTEIEDACRKLISDKNANLDSRKPNYEPIRQIIRKKRNLPPGADIGGLGDETIRKVIAPILDEAKAASHKLSHKL